MKTMPVASSNVRENMSGYVIVLPLPCSHGGPSEFRLCVCITIFVASAGLSLREELWNWDTLLALHHVLVSAITLWSYVCRG